MVLSANAYADIVTTTAAPKKQPRLDPLGPTQTLPGSPEKLQILEYRRKSGFQLWHPGDKRESRLALDFDSLSNGAKIIKGHRKEAL